MLVARFSRHVTTVVREEHEVLYLVLLQARAEGGDGVGLYLSVSSLLVSVYIKFGCSKFCLCLSVLKRKF
jgi:hypothetical protein